jgi:hypothetical protein
LEPPLDSIDFFASGFEGARESPDSEAGQLPVHRRELDRHSDF